MSSTTPLVHRDGWALLDGVVPMSWASGQMCEFASALVRMLASAGEAVPYHTIMGVTGVAFRFTMGPELWNPGFYGFAGVTGDAAELIRRAFAAVGYAYHWSAHSRPEVDRPRIVASLNRGLPVMLRGHVVDASDWALAVGYHTTDDRLLGLSPYDDHQHYDGRHILAVWHQKAMASIVLGEPNVAVAPDEVYRAALRLAVALVRSTDVYRGLNAYGVLAGALRKEAFPAQPEREQDSAWWRYLCLLCYNMMLDDHQSAAPFLRDAAEALPAVAAELEAAAQGYEQSCAVRRQLEEILPSSFAPDAELKVLDAAVRERFAATIEQIREVEAQAIAHVERALSGL